MDSSLWDAIEKVERRHWWFRGRRELVAAVLRRHVAPGSRVVDVGCGTGFVLERLLDDYDAWGLEPDPSVRARAGQRAASRILAGSTDDLSTLEPGSFDAALLLDVLEHVDDDLHALVSVLALLPPPGVVLITVPAFPSLWTSHDVRNGHRRRYTRGTLEGLLKKAGLTPLVLSHVNARLFPLAMVHRLISGVFGSRTDRELALPPPFVNDAFTRIFAGEAAGTARGYPFGLSLLAVARRASHG